MTSTPPPPDPLPSSDGFLDALPDAVALIGLDRRIIRVNREMARRLGIAPESAIGARCHELLHGTTSPPPLCPHERSFRDGRVVGPVVWEEEADGGVYEVRAAPIPGPDGSVQAYLYSARAMSDQVRVQRESEASEARFRTLAERSRDLICRFDRTHRLIYANPAAAGALAPPGRELVGLTLAETELRPDEASAWESRLAAVFRTGRTTRDEFTITGRSRTTILDGILTPEAGPDGEVGSVMGTFRDVSERRREEVQRELLLELIRVFGTARPLDQVYGLVAQFLGRRLRYPRVTIDRWDAEGRRVTRLAAWGTLGGGSGRENDRFFDALVVRVARTERSHVEVSDAVPDSAPPSAEAPDRDGPARTVVSVPLFVRGRVTMVLSLMDSTPRPDAYDVRDTLQVVAGQMGHEIDRRWALAELEENQRRLATLLSNLPGMAYRCRNDRAWTMEFVSDGCVALTGHRPQALLGNAGISYAEIIHPEDRERVWEEVQRALASKQPFELTYRIVTARNEVRWVWEQGRGVWDSEGNLIALEGFITDITARRRAEEENARLQERVAQAQKMESVGRLAGGVAHDFNNMLSVILGHTELALARLEGDHPVRSDLVAVKGAAERSARLTGQLLAFARRQTISPRPVDLNAAIDGMITMLRRLIGEEIELIWKPGENLGAVRMDPTQVDQLLANLCVNARDAIDGCGTVTIETRKVDVNEDDCADREGLEPGPYVVLSVTDDGSGMDEETASHVFEPFFTTKPAGKGTGLGLATVYGIVKQNGGFLEVETEIGRGSRFSIYFRCQRGEGAETAFREGPRRARGRGETILLVEDERPVLALTAEILRSLGYRVLTAGSPTEALELAAAHGEEIDLLLSDVVMPRMNGLELAHRLSEQRPRLKTLYMSGYTDDVIADRGVLRGGVDCLLKPFTPDELARRVRDVLDRPGRPDRVQGDAAFRTGGGDQPNTDVHASGWKPTR